MDDTSWEDTIAWTINPISAAHDKLQGVNRPHTVSGPSSRTENRELYEVVMNLYHDVHEAANFKTHGQ